MLYDPLNDYDQVGKTLIKAARYMQEHGHCVVLMEESLGGRVCVLGALSNVIYGHTTDDVWGVNSSDPHYPLVTGCLQALASEVLEDPHWLNGTFSGAKGVSDGCIVTTYNDCYATKEIALDLFNKAAAKHKVSA